MVRESGLFFFFKELGRVSLKRLYTSRSKNVLSRFGGRAFQKKGQEVLPH